MTQKNLDRMLRGSAPIGTDGKSVVLHHLYGIANNFGRYDEMLVTTHTSNYKALHWFLFVK